MLAFPMATLIVTMETLTKAVRIFCRLYHFDIAIDEIFIIITHHDASHRNSKVFHVLETVVFANHFRDVQIINFDLFCECTYDDLCNSWAQKNIVTFLAILYVTVNILLY